MFKIISTLSQETRTEVDTDGDGTPDRFDVDTDGDGILDRREFDTDQDGIFNRIEYLDEAGRWERVERDLDDDGTIDRITHYAFDSDGNRRETRRDVDLDDDGNIDRTVHLNADGRWERDERDDDDDGFIDRIIHYAFDSDGNRSVTRRDFDLDDDGTIDRIAHLDADGRWERVERDADDDGFIDRITHFAFDSDGNRRVTRRDEDLDDDGNIDRRVHLNADGRWERVERDNNDDGTIDRTVHRNTDTGAINRIDFDDDGDGTTDRSEFYTQNTDNDRNRTNFDDDADGTIDRSEDYSYIARFLTRTDFDDDEDGTTDRNETYTYNIAGDLTRTNFDDDNDGTIDRSEDYVYFRGMLNQIDFDDDEDGTTDRSEDYIYDANGRVFQTNFDDDNDDTIDRIETYTYDGNGRVSQASFDDDVDGTVDRIETYTYDGNGRVSQTSFDDNNNGTVNRSEAYTYYGNGRVSQTGFDDNNDGTVDRIESYTYDANGRVSQTGFDGDVDGTIDRIERALSSLDGTNGFTLTGIAATDNFGRSVSSAGDVNGDGYDDLIIGAFGADPNGSGSGETYIVYGGASAPGTDGVLDLSRLALDGNGFTLAGISELDDSGISVSSAGDVNGDGYDDLIIGAQSVGTIQGEYDRFPGPGEAYVVYGGATGADLTLDRSTLDGTRGFALTGISADDEFGFSVSSAGDVNGDGYDDLIIGANGVGSSAGATYVVYGGASAPGTNGVLDISMLDGTNGFTLTGIDADDYSGRSVSSAGDVNGDGYDDLIIGAYGADLNGNDDAGETYVIYGGASAPGIDGVLELSDLDGTNGFTLTGSVRNNHVGFSVSSAGDVNGDGYDDLIIGADGNDPGGEIRAGEAFIVYGGASAPGTNGVLDLSTLDGTNGFILTGIDGFDRVGDSVSSAGDVNGDGYDDLIIGAQDADPNGNSSAGETYLVYGGASAPGTGGVLDLGALDGSNGFILTGIDVGDNAGISVSSAGDINGDGYDDLIIGASGADPNGINNAGESYVIYGGATGTESLTPVTASGTAAADNFTGNAGDDSFTAIATDDVVRGAAGDDTISVTALDFAAIDGGTGVDTLVLDGAGLALDLTGPGHAGVDSVEVFDLSGTGANSLVLDALAVFDVTEEREGGVASLDVLGDADDRVDLSGSSFALTGTATEDGVTYNVYRDGNAQVRVEDGVSVTLAAAGSQSAESKTDIRIDPVADPRTDPGTGTIRLDGALMNPDPLMNNDLWNNDLWNNDLWDDLWADGVKSPDQPVHIDEDAILIPLSDPLSFGPLASGPLPGPWGDLMYWPGLESHPAMQNDLAMILPEMEIVTAYMEGF